MTDRTTAISAFLADGPELADPDAVLCAVISRWPDATAEEIERAMEITLNAPIAAPRNEEAEMAAHGLCRGLWGFSGPCRPLPANGEHL